MVMLSEEVLRGSSWLMIIVGAATYLALQIIAAPYGRHSSSSWGPLIPARLSWMIMESPNLWMPFVIYWISSSQGSIPLTGNHLPNLALLAMFYIHYIHRTLLFPIMMPATRPMPLTVMLCAFSYCLWNSFNQSLSLLLFTNYPSHWLSTPQFLCGALLFFGGLCTNIYADHRLLYLKRQGHQQGKEYIVPKGWLFDFISCPNYFGEVLEWVGFALAANNLAGWAFALYTASNLVPRAHANHRWYLQKFEDYPSHRKAIFPFVW